MIRLGAIDPAPLVAMNPGHPIPDDRQRQVEERRGLHQPHPATQIQVDDRRFQGPVLRAVDQVEAVRCFVPQTILNPPNRVLDGFERQPRRAENPEHASPAHRLDQLHGRDSVGHGACHACVADAVHRSKRGFADVGDQARGDVRRRAVGRGCRRGVESNRAVRLDGGPETGADPAQRVFPFVAFDLVKLHDPAPPAVTGRSASGRVKPAVRPASSDGEGHGGEGLGSAGGAVSARPFRLRTKQIYQRAAFADRAHPTTG